MDENSELSRDFALALLPERTKFAKFRKFKCPDSTCNHVWADATKPIHFALCPGCFQAAPGWENCVVD